MLTILSLHVQLLPVIALDSATNWNKLKLHTTNETVCQSTYLWCFVNICVYFFSSQFNSARLTVNDCPLLIHGPSSLANIL